ncbi:hypothetical protein DQ04_05601040 [Trypanosoma grayi]|uniref:hypothetical protein n=1 Tax=Trypanosoma grayi TaxID=71804 RepID=UPI0004F411CD|nr:hypothetical protein DQ04_05601040 [Trypanosoma grayi]KEG09215.1 hypothetical protein DQ04_05601040 [Trypanosoma grayi]
MRSCESHRPTEEDAKIKFLADAQHQLSVQCCRSLALLTVRTGRPFLSVAKRGRSPPGSSAKGESADDTTVRRDEFGMHEEAYRSVRSAIAASCTLGHRSCHALWGPRGCGEHRILRLVAQDCIQRDQTLVLYLDGDTLNGDEDALRSIAQQILQFLKSPQSAKLRAADWSLRTGTFEFGKLFGFPKLLEQKDEETDDRDNDDDNKDSSTTWVCNRPSAGRRRRSGRDSQENLKKETKKRRRSPSPDVLERDDECSDEEEDSLLVTATTAYAAGGASSALPVLQRTLLLMKSYGANLVICIRRVERFGVWCDKLLYVLSGLMHESDGRGGGMSLVMTSFTPDIRQLEKRLSSRLTCETRCIPLLPWSTSRVARACLVEVQERLQRFIAKQATAKEKRAKKSLNGNPSDGDIDHESNPFIGWRFDVLNAKGEHQQHHQEELWDTASNLGRGRTQLFEQTMLEMATNIIAELDAATRVAEETSGGNYDNAFARHIVSVSGQLRSIGATAGRVVAAVSAAIGMTCSGRLPLLNAASRKTILSWLTSRLATNNESVDFRPAFSTAPKAVQTLWLSTRSGCLPFSTIVGRNVEAVTLSSCSHQILFDDLLSNCRLAELGYCSRETFIILAYVYLRHEAGVMRTVTDLLEDVASSMGTQAAAALDRTAFRAAITALHRWRILRIAGRDGSSGVVSLRGSPARLRDFLQSVLRRADYCGQVLGLEAKEITRLRSLV